jgi:signal transduction histidine kinase
MNSKLLHKSHLLIVDDNPTNIDVLFQYLDDAGFAISVAENGESALEQCEYYLPDLILLDVMMPGMDGFETCRRLKGNPETAEIPVVFMTALTDVVDKVKGFSVGAVDYVTKPFQHEEVLARIKTHLALRSLQQELASKVIALQESNRALQEANAALQTSNAELDAFAHTVAHDLKGSLAGIVLNVEFMRIYFARLSEEKMLEKLESVHGVGMVMTNIIDELLLLAGVRKELVEMVPLDMARIVKHAQTRLNMMIKRYQGEIVLPDSWPVAHGHAPWIEEVWINYLSNGLKYGGTPPRLELGATTQADGMVRYWVRDNGPGIPLETRNKLFAEFTRLEQTRAQGHGLGLSIVKRIVEKLGGRVGMESADGQGSTFYFSLKESTGE